MLWLVSHCSKGRGRRRSSLMLDNVWKNVKWTDAYDLTPIHYTEYQELFLLEFRADLNMHNESKRSWTLCALRQKGYCICSGFDSLINNHFYLRYRQPQREQPSRRDTKCSFVRPKQLTYVGLLPVATQRLTSSMGNSTHHYWVTLSCDIFGQFIDWHDQCNVFPLALIFEGDGGHKNSPSTTIKMCYILGHSQIACINSAVILHFVEKNLLDLVSRAAHEQRLVLCPITTTRLRGDSCVGYQQSGYDTSESYKNYKYRHI